MCVCFRREKTEVATMYMSNFGNMKVTKPLFSPSLGIEPYRIKG